MLSATEFGEGCWYCRKSEATGHKGKVRNITTNTTNMHPSEMQRGAISTESENISIVTSTGCCVFLLTQFKAAVGTGATMKHVSQPYAALCRRLLVSGHQSTAVCRGSFEKEWVPWTSEDFVLTFPFH